MRSSPGPAATGVVPSADSAPSKQAIAPTSATSAATNRTASRVARQIEADIVARNWPIGEVLGSESDLMGRYDVSRAVLRESIRLVEHHTAASMRRGPSGGLVVRAPDPTAAITAIVIYLEYLGVSAADLISARIPLEKLAASLAAGRMTEESITGLRQTLEREHSIEPAARQLRDFDDIHQRIGTLSGNPALALLIDVLCGLTVIYGSMPDLPAQAAQASVADGALDAHRSLAEAIIAGDSERAAHRAEVHLKGKGRWLQFRPHARGQTWSPAAVGGKLAEAVSHRIRADIAEAGWPIGEVLGSEPELMIRYDVSRATLREAIRLLEHHSIAHMRRGRGGGLVVTRPESLTSVDAMALFLTYQNAGNSSLHAIREVIELECVRQVSLQAGEPAAGVRLRNELTAEGSGLHQQIAAASGNQVLPILLGILTRLDFYQRPDPQENGPTDAVDHALILEAVLAGDAALAQHRMRRHLRVGC